MRMRLLFYSSLVILLWPAAPILAQEEAEKLLPEFHIMSADGQDTLFSARHVYLHYSPDSSQVSIEHEALYRLVFCLPYHDLRMDHLEVTWDREGKALFFHSNDTHNRFYFTHPEKRELEFSSTGGMLDLEDKVLTVKNVPGIYTGNAMIVPENHEMRLHGPQLPSLPKAQVILNIFTRYHHLISDKVKIQSRKDFDCGNSLHYQYYHAPTRKTYLFTKVSLTSEKIAEDFKVSFETTITLKISPEEKFELFEGYYFKGEARAKDWEREFQFDGYIGKKPKGGKSEVEWTPYEGKEQLGRF